MYGSNLSFEAANIAFELRFRFLVGVIDGCAVISGRAADELHDITRTLAQCSGNAVVGGVACTDNGYRLPVRIERGIACRFAQVGARGSPQIIQREAGACCTALEIHGTRCLCAHSQDYGIVLLRQRRQAYVFSHVGAAFKAHPFCLH